MTENHPDHGPDADVNGHLATALFVGVIVMMLLVIYGIAVAA